MGPRLASRLLGVALDLRTQTFVLRDCAALALIQGHAVRAVAYATGSIACRGLSYCTVYASDGIATLEQVARAVRS